MDNSTLIEGVRKVRQRVCDRQVERLLNRYPECGEINVSPVSDDEIIRQALVRELHHQTSVLNDLERKVDR